MHFEFKLASQWQAREIFRCFYPAVDSGDEREIDMLRVTSTTLTSVQRDALAESFAECVPDRAFSMASLQGYLVRHKSNPYEAVQSIRAFVETEKKKQAAAAVASATTELLPRSPRTPGFGNRTFVPPKSH